ncbi:MAG: hypothetical protein COA79_03320 [Planctomycetota bacterium]|nr:MAG: hypothetical protein COA79_03320 [Planctomycetota bacterium]
MTSFESAKKLFKLISHSPFDFFIASCFVIVLATVELPLPIFMAILIDNIIPSGDTKNLIFVGLLLFGFRAGASIFQVIQNYIVAIIINDFTANIRKSMIFKMLRMPYQNYLNAEAHGMATRFSEDVDKVSEFAQHTIVFLIRPILSFTFIMTLMMFWNVPLALYCLIIIPAITLATRLIRSRMQMYSLQQKVCTEKLEIKIVEALSNIKIIRAFTAEEIFHKKADVEIENIEKSSISFKLWSEFANKSIEIIRTLNQIGFIFFAAWQVFDGNLTLGGFIALQTMADGVRSPIAQIMFYFTNFSSKAVSLDRVYEVIDQKQEQEDNHHLKKLEAIEGNIKFKNIDLIYGKTRVLNNITLDIPKGQMVALVGPSGAGKTSLTNLLMGLVKPDDGQIYIDDYSLRGIDIYSLRDHMGVVYQESILFNNTVKYNMLMGSANATNDAIWEALEIANAKEFIENLPNKLDTIIGVNGIKLSGGQQQRLSIARAILSNPKIMILDEATSSLDSTSELEIKMALDNALKDRTSIVIAHRLSTIVNADKIIVIDKGKIIDSGTHQELIQKKSGLYYELYQTQTEGLENYKQSK